MRPSRNVDKQPLSDGARGQRPANSEPALYRISQLFNSILDPDLLLERVMDEALSTMNAERGFIVLCDEKAEQLSVRVARRFEQSLEQGLSDISQTALRQVLAERTARVWLDAPKELPASRSVIVGQVRSIACAPLVCRSRLLGAIYVDSRTDRNVFHEDVRDFLQAFASIAALAIENARLVQQLSFEKQDLVRRLGREQFPEIIGRSPRMQEVFELMNRVVPTDSPVLIWGETGTGKELVARAIHYSGPRRSGPFVPVNCSAIPENLLESELFGHRKGAFTGAVADRKGVFEAASGGTIFLDEVGDLPKSLQPKLLRVLQDGEIRRVGETQPLHVDVRVISATNRDLSRLVAEGNFREDLYYRLNVIPIHLPPLRERPEDVPLLANHFLATGASRLGKQVKGIAPEALEKLVAYSWPGNIRQLENVLERALVLCGERVEPGDLMLPEPSPTGPPTASSSMAEIEKQVVLERLKRFGGNRTKTAASLGISRRTLLNKLAEWKQEQEK
ncbi:MAG: sigma-54-dependent Fis family transcriptional regulator [candidate division WOR-3 bacterium]